LRSGVRSHPALAAQTLFALLVVATVGAFFVATRLKRSSPVVEKLTFARRLSPNGDGRHDFTVIAFRIKKDDQVTVSIVTKQGDEVSELASDRRLGRGRHRFRWNGRTAGGAVVPDGEYHVRIRLRRQGRSVTSPRKIFVDTTPPRPVVRYVSPEAISPDGAGSGNRAMLRFEGPHRGPPTLLVYRTDIARPRLVARHVVSARSGRLSWDGLVGSSRRPAATGDYALVVRVRDAAGNVGPSGLPPARGRLPGHAGIVVRYVSARGPTAPVRGGSVTSFAVQADNRRYRWRIHRLGSRHAVDRGSSRSRRLHVRAPRGRSGVFLLDLRVARHRYATPFAVQAGVRRRLLVVLPATTWEARNEFDGDGDGFPDSLPAQRSAAIGRPVLGGGLPSQFASEEVPLLRYLDRAGRRYDITTDAALASGKARPPIRYRGVLFAGPPRFVPVPVSELMRSYVRAGGRLSWFGTEGFTRFVNIGPKTLTLVSGPRGGIRNIFGERLRGDRKGGLLTVVGDTIRFFAGVSGSFGPFRALERTQALPRGAKLLASAGDQAETPSVVVYRFGRGVVARVGAGGFPRRASNSPDIARIMRRLWILLSR
jgi:hypothetical protein